MEAKQMSLTAEDWLSSLDAFSSLDADANNSQFSHLFQPAYKPVTATAPLQDANSGGSTSSGHELLSDKERHKLASKKAQQKFREKQKDQLNSLLKEVAEKAAAYEHLARENEELKQRSRVLEKVVFVREEQVDLLTQFRDACPAIAVTVNKDTSTWGLPDHGTDISAADAERINHMTMEEFIKTWKLFLSQVSSYLVRCDGPNPDPTLLSKLSELVTKNQLWAKQIIMNKTEVVRQAMTVNLETAQPSTADEAHWLSVVSSMNLTLAQRQDMVGIFALYKGLLDKVYEERKLLMETMGIGCIGMTCPVERNALARDMELMEHLKANLQKEHCARILLYAIWLGPGLSPVQAAKVCMNSYPFFPDTLAIAVATEQYHLTNSHKHPRS